MIQGERITTMTPQLGPTGVDQASENGQIFCKGKAVIKLPRMCEGPTFHIPMVVCLVIYLDVNLRTKLDD